MNLKNDLAQAKSKPWYKFIISSSSPTSGYRYKRVENNILEIALHPFITGLFTVAKSWTKKKAEHQRIDTFELWGWRKLFRVPWTARRSNQSILKKSVLNIHWKD